MRILVLNGGSSSFKIWFHDVHHPLPVEAPQPRWQANVPWHGTPPLDEVLPPALEKLWSGPQRVINGPDEVETVGHRIVHGGPYYETTRLLPEVRTTIRRQAEFAPAHNRFELEAIETMERLLGTRVPQFAVFDTGFHHTLEEAAYVYPAPYEWLADGVRRYGFHGISYQYATRRARQMLGPDRQRLILCHLGNGASITAVRDGKSVDTTMGFTPLEGLMMGSRCGSIDPGILIYLLRHRGYTADQLDRILNRESGLKGVSGMDGDMREILRAAAQGNRRAQLAFDIYTHRVTREAGAMLAVLGGMDALVFTGGVGENTSLLRESVCRQFGFMGLELDPSKNGVARGDVDIATPQSRVRVLVIHAQEEWEIARECYRVTLRDEEPAAYGGSLADSPR
jgi:acetate kinase